MKRILCVSLILFALFSLSASSLQRGYNATLLGESYGGDSFGAVELSGVLSPLGEKHIGDLELDVVFALEKPHWRGFNVSVSSPVAFVFCDFRAFPNPVLWEPKLTLGYQYRMDAGHRAMVGVSPLSFASSGFVYEFFSPYLTMDLEQNLGWGIRVMKFTAYL